MQIVISIYTEGQTKRKVRDYVAKISADGKSRDEAHIKTNNPDIVAHLVDLATNYGEFSFDVST